MLNEDTSSNIHLSASDPDGDVLTYTLSLRHRTAL